MARSPLHMPCMLDCEITVYFMIVISYRMAGRFRPQLTRFLGLARVLELVLGRPPCVAFNLADETRRPTGEKGSCGCIVRGIKTVDDAVAAEHAACFA